MRLIVIAFVFVAAAGLLRTLRAEEMSHTKDSLEQVKKAVSDQSALLVDVREQGEWDKGHIKDAKLLPLSALKSGEKIPADWPKDKPIYTHCVAGVRSLRAAEILKKLGYDARALKPGYEELLKNGFEAAPK